MAEKKDGTGSKVNGPPAVSKCSCEHSYQDSKFGKGMRFMNYAPKLNGNKGGHRCTVCSKTY